MHGVKFYLHYIFFSTYWPSCFIIISILQMRAHSNRDMAFSKTVSLIFSLKHWNPGSDDAKYCPFHSYSTAPSESSERLSELSQALTGADDSIPSASGSPISAVRCDRWVGVGVLTSKQSPVTVSTLLTGDWQEDPILLSKDSIEQFPASYWSYSPTKPSLQDGPWEGSAAIAHRNLLSALLHFHPLSSISQTTE